MFFVTEEAKIGLNNTLSHLAIFLIFDTKLYVPVALYQLKLMQNYYNNWNQN